MPRYPVKQPNGKYAIFSTVVDHFIAYDATPEEIMESFRQEAITESDRVTARGLKRADDLGAARFDESIETVRLIHGDKVADEYMALLTGTPHAGEGRT